MGNVIHGAIKIFFLAQPIELGCNDVGYSIEMGEMIKRVDFTISYLDICFVSNTSVRLNCLKPTKEKNKYVIYILIPLIKD